MRGDAPDHEPDIDPQGSPNLQDIWQSQKKEYDAMTLADIHMKASKFEKKVSARNAREYVACGLTIVGFAPALLLGPNWMLHVGGGLVILATLYVAWQLHRRGSSEATPAVGETLIDSYRRQLARQRDALNTIGKWYLAPFAPGIILMLIGIWFRAPKPGVPIERVHAGLLIWATVFVLSCGFIWWLNKRGARLLQKRIDEL